MSLSELARDDKRTIVLSLTETGKEKQREAIGANSTLTKRLARIIKLPKEDLLHLLRTHELILDKFNQREGEK